MTLRGAALWLAAAAVSFAGFALHLGPRLGNDSYQYLSVAENLAQTGRNETSLVHFDEERSHGIVPAPQTTFPPGYPAIIAALARLGLAQETAAVVISLASSVLLTLLLWQLCDVLGCGWAATQFCLALWLCSYYAAYYARSIATEAAFTAIMTASLVLLLKGDAALHDRGTVVASTYWALLLAGISTWIRYAGLFVLAAYAVYVAGILIRRNVRGRAPLVVSLGMSLTIALILLSRNWILTHTLGSNTKQVANPFLETLRTGMEAVPKLVFSGAADGNLYFAAIAAAAVVMMGVQIWSREVFWQPARPLLLTGWVVAVYCGMMFYTALHTVITFGFRYFVPILPALLAVIAWLVGTAWTPAPAKGIRRLLTLCATVLFVSCYLTANVRSVLTPVRPDPSVDVRRRLTAHDESGRPLNTWIDDHIAPTDILFATQGQVTGYVLHRPVVAAVGHDFSTVDWTETAVHRVMRTHRAAYLIVYPGAAPGEAPSQVESSFLADLTHGVHPEWLAIAAHNPYVMVYRRLQ